MVRIYYPRNL